jgi:hypothetical protein
LDLEEMEDGGSRGFAVESRQDSARKAAQFIESWRYRISRPPTSFHKPKTAEERLAFLKARWRDLAHFEKQYEERRRALEVAAADVKGKLDAADKQQFDEARRQHAERHNRQKQELDNAFQLKLKEKRDHFLQRLKNRDEEFARRAPPIMAGAGAVGSGNTPSSNSGLKRPRSPSQGESDSAQLLLAKLMIGPPR